MEKVVVSEKITGFQKAIMILLVGIVAILATNMLRVSYNELSEFVLNSEGLNYAIGIFAIGTALIGAFASNKDRKTFGFVVVILGIFAAIYVGREYISWVVFCSFSVFATVCSLLVAFVPHKYP